MSAGASVRLMATGRPSAYRAERDFSRSSHSASAIGVERAAMRRTRTRLVDSEAAKTSMPATHRTVGNDNWANRAGDSKRSGESRGSVATTPGADVALTSTSAAGLGVNVDGTATVHSGKRRLNGTTQAAANSAAASTRCRSAAERRPSAALISSPRPSTIDDRMARPASSVIVVPSGGRTPRRARP